MSLDRYWKKRDFGRTPEPAGDAPRSGPPAGTRRFVVQRHRATRLHYDVRFEIEGVLMSWAVPRGPSMRPLERRHAARTEDHPLEYFDFEGVIPRGEYGAGDVIVWDWGTWEPEAETPDPGRAIRAGELKLVVSGERLRGRFVLVRTSRHEEDREEWLLIHKRDETSDEAWDIDAFPTSVKSGRTNDEVRDGVPAIWLSGAPAADAEIDLTAAKDARMPDFIPPMAATLTDRPFSDPDWLFELKLDGYRVQAVVRDGAVKLWTRNHLDAARYFPELAAARPTWLLGDEAIVDGEVVALDPDGRPDFSLLQDRTGMKGLAQRRGERRPPAEGAAGPSVRDPDAPLAPLVFHAFDLLHLDGRSLLDVPLEDRKRLLKARLRPHPQVRYLSHIVEDGELFFASVAEQRLEGVIAKLRRSRYEPGRRSRAWLKVKARRDQELVVVGYEPGKGTHTDLGSLIVATYEDGAFRFAGEVGSGLDTRLRRQLRKELDAIRVDLPPVVDAPRLPDARWVEPRLVIRAAFSEWTSDGLLRQSSFLGREPDRDPRSVQRERPLDTESARDAAEKSAERRERTRRVAAPPEADPAARPSSARPARPVDSAIGRVHPGPSVDPDPRAALPLVRAPGRTGDPAEAVTQDELDALDALGKGGTWSVGGHTVHLTNLDKVLFPVSGITKRDLVRYYATIAPVLLPYLRGRPLNVHRWPDGITGRTSFWQKQIPTHAPEWVARWDYPEAGHDQSHTYVVADRVATLAWLANQAVIDLHPWTSTAAAYTTPSYALIDLDPGSRTTWDELLLLARLNRTALEHLGVTGFPKVTGKRGIQVWIPIEPRYTFDETRDWVGQLSAAIGATVPELVSWDWAKKDRGGKARLDFTQNAINKTLVAPYAVRPAEGAPVSVPIAWDELDDPELRPGRWDIHSVLERVAATGDPFRGALALTQRLPSLEPGTA
ncbi:MAG: non-homologous end-joining DNA ligase [Chloroflexota bacterium]